MTQPVIQYECEYCGAVQSRVWRKVVSHDDGTRREVWCCDECYNTPEEDGGDPMIEVLGVVNTDYEGDTDEEIIDLCDE